MRPALVCATAAWLLPVVAGAGVAPTQTTEYCVDGTGSGAGWGWEVRLGPTVLLAGSSSGVSGTSADVRNEFSSSIETARLGAMKNYPTSGVVSPTPAACTGDAFDVTGIMGFELWVTDTGGTLTQVTGPDITAAVDFNPSIYIPLPEPGATPLLVSGALALAALHGRRVRRTRASRAQVAGGHRHDS